jgi:Beta-lactamase/Anticodon binding domain
MWQHSEALLRQALERVGAAYVEAEGETAFYGPKIDLQVSDLHGREETLSTIQVDLLLPHRFGLRYDRDSERQRPIIVHRSIIGTLERMTAHLLEVHNGALPPWLSPTQVLVLPGGDDARRYATDVTAQLASHGLRTELDERNATLGARIRAAQPRKIPYLAVVGEREQQAQTISLRLRNGDSVAHVLVERDEHAYGQRVADSGSQFAAHGKSGVTLADVLTNTAGVPGLWPQITREDLSDWDRVCAFIAQQPPWWPPGTKTGYHALTFGFVLGEFVRRATGRTLAAVLREEITSPLGISDEPHFGVPHHLGRVARAGPEGAAPPPPESGSPQDRVIPPGVQPSAAFTNREDVLTADIPSQATMTARAAANVRRAARPHRGCAASRQSICRRPPAQRSQAETK